MKPQRIILIRHGESAGNVDGKIYAERPDYALPLSENGKSQALEAGKKLGALIGTERIKFYVSPHWRTRMTFEEIEKSFAADQFIYREEPRIREQEWGHFRTEEYNEKINLERDSFGTFYFRMPDGESCADVYDRVSSFFETLYRDFEKKDFPENVIIVTHGMTIRVFLMRWFHWTVEEFEQVSNPRNCEFFVMIRNKQLKYDLITPLRKHPVMHSFHYPFK